MPEARRGHPIMAGYELRSACASGRQRRWTQASGSRPTLRSDCRDLRGVPGARLEESMWIFVGGRGSYRDAPSNDWPSWTR